ncbi:uncharacterized protein LOC100384211 precursor [Zea mays]|uniref:Protein kinase superfamily protein n=1 Tax=Zea mays TaxID=4577 RepID=C0PMI3_MAIZE|nr:uncharacterized protein LOC100384211 precursor [Zea mays]ACN36399.1 unknown [Zea mays]AQK80512.1 Protein kinase superfamily protein [Zea mays]|eukprot:NP_001170254.1 uncharacterized protein LOC100384211 precursor [Zea mays]
MSRHCVTLLVIIFGLLQMAVALYSNPSSTHPNCTERCGNVSIQYPFGFGSGCFRQPDFSLTCDGGGGGNQPPKTFLHDGITEVLPDSGVTVGLSRLIDVAISHTIFMAPGIPSYNFSWNLSSFTMLDGSFNVTGCDFDIYRQEPGKNGSIPRCTNSCPQNITETVARQNCNGTGCCRLYVGEVVPDFQLKFVLHNNDTRGDHDALSNGSTLWNTINITSNWAQILWDIDDQPTCSRAKDKNINYACVSNYSHCFDAELFDIGYRCGCNSGYVGNPYVVDGCKRDEGYSPNQLKENCSRSCGNISVPYPFGLEEGCSARKLFKLNCRNATASMLQFDDDRVVAFINVAESLVGIRFTSHFEDDQLGIYVPGEPDLFMGLGESVVSMHWAAANLTCDEALKNKSQYACVSSNSKCLGVNSKDGYIGYRCKCLDGFQGNPYTISDGCEGTT